MSHKIVVIPGSLRRESFSLQIANTLQELAPQGATVEVLQIGDLPFFNEDLKGDASPQVVQDLAAKVTEADALVLVSPEYNRSMSGVLKNALDWLSKEPAAPLSSKPVEVITQSPGATGGLVANYAIRDVVSVCGAEVMTGFETAIGGVSTKVEGGKLVEQAARDFVVRKLGLLVAKADAVKTYKLAAE